MNKNAWLNSRIALLAMLMAWAPMGWGQTPDSAPTITSIAADAKTVTIVVSVPVGVRQVTLESRTRLGAGTWVPRAVQRISAAGDVTFQFNKSENLEVLRVRGDAQEPLPGNFFLGKTNFNGQASTYDPSMSYRNGGIYTAAGPGATDTTAPTANSTRTVVESDIWKIDGNRLYFFNQYRGLQVIDISQPDAPAILGTLELPAAGEQMYLLDKQHVVLLAAAETSNSGTPTSQVLVVNVAGEPKVVASLPLQGSIQESRLVGTALYVASDTYREITIAGKDGGTAISQWESGTIASSFDLANPEAPVSRSTLWFAGYGNAIYATDEYLVAAVQSTNNYWQSVLNLVDISSPDGTMKAVSAVTTAGRVADKFKMNQAGDVLTVASEAWTQQSRTNNGRYSVIQTFSLTDPTNPQKLGYLEIGHGEGLYATRFDGSRIYVVTFLRTDPLWVVDLQDPANPKIAGELQVPGWSTYIQPLGNELVAIGIDNSNSWKVAVSLFDVSNPAKPGLLAKVPLGTDYSWSEANYDEKALTVLPDAGLILVPYQGSDTNGWVNRVQLIELGANSLKARGVIDHTMQPRRSTVYANRILSISGRDLLTVDASDRDNPKVTADLELSWPVNQICLAGDFLIEVSAGAVWEGIPNPVLRVVKPAALFKVLGRLELTDSVPILGATVQGNRFYLAQGQVGSSGIVPLGDSSGSQDSGKANGPNLFLSIFDLGALPALKLVGHTEITTTNLSWNPTLTPLWPKDNLLVWSQSGGMIYYATLLPVGGIARPMPWYGGGGSGCLFAFDVSDATAPKLASEVNLTTTNGWWSFSSAYVAQGLVYMSHQSTTFIPSASGPQPPPPSGTTPDGTKDTNSPPTGTWVTKYYLDVVDYADQANPTIRKPVNIPGQLRGLARSGALLYTVGPHWNDQGQTDWTQYLDASGYDGVNAYLVDSLKPTNSLATPQAAQDGTIFVAQSNDGTTGQWQAWTVSVGGKFTLLSSAKMPAQPSNFKVIGTLLAVQASQTVSLYEVSNPSNPQPLASDDTFGWIYPNLSNADGAVNKGLWVPLQDYGVWGVTVGR